jgi:hypothetical protein
VTFAVVKTTRLLLIVAAVTSCREEICDCLSPAAVLRGEVQFADSTPATSAVTWWVVYADTTCAVPAQTGGTIAVDAGAGYSHQAYGYDQPRCVAVYAAPSAARQDSARATRVHTFRADYPPDTLHMPVIRLP